MIKVWVVDNAEGIVEDERDVNSAVTVWKQQQQNTHSNTTRKQPKSTAYFFRVNVDRHYDYKSRLRRFTWLKTSRTRCKFDAKPASLTSMQTEPQPNAKLWGPIHFRQWRMCRSVQSVICTSAYQLVAQLCAAVTSEVDVFDVCCARVSSAWPRRRHHRWNINQPHPARSTQEIRGGSRGGI